MARVTYLPRIAPPLMSLAWRSATRRFWTPDLPAGFFALSASLADCFVFMFFSSRGWCNRRPTHATRGRSSLDSSESAFDVLRVLLAERQCLHARFACGFCGFGRLLRSLLRLHVSSQVSIVLCTSSRRAAFDVFSLPFADRQVRDAGLARGLLGLDRGFRGLLRLHVLLQCVTVLR